jgi:hypothetical protein
MIRKETLSISPNVKKTDDWRIHRGGRQKISAHQTFHDPGHEPRSVGGILRGCLWVKEEEKAFEDPNFYLTDGTVTMVLAPYKISDYLGTEHKRPGFDHIGFEVEDLRGFEGSRRSRFLAPLH